MTPIEWTVVAGALAAIGLVNWWFFMAGQTVAVAAPAMAMTGGAGTAAVPEVVIVVDGGYAPNTIRAKAGAPIRLVFDRQDDSSCSEEVVIPAFNVRKYLPTGQRTTIEITPPEAGRIPFTCGMGMLKGSILVDP